MLRKPYPKQVVKDVIERRTKGPVPLAWHKWRGEGLYEAHGTVLDKISADIPDDVLIVGHKLPGDWESSTNDSDYRWAYSGTQKPEHHGIDSTEWLSDWDDLDRYLAEFPDPEKQQEDLFAEVRETVTNNPDTYILGVLWQGFYERSWFIRGMENLLIDFMMYPDQAQKLLQAILEYHCKAIRRMAALGVDGILITDDVGGQTSLMMSPAMFRDILKPFYRQLIAEVHRHGMHFWLHTCGNVMEIIDDLIEVGVDVLHPIQAGTMDYQEVVDRFAGRISFLVGFDVQHKLPEGSEAEVRAEVGKLERVFGDKGGFLLGAGNGILPLTPINNIRAFLEEASLIGEQNER